MTNIGSLDWMTFSLYLSLIAVGWLMIYTVGYDKDNPTNIFDLSTIIGKQTLWICISGVILLITIIIDRTFWQTFAYLVYAVGMGLLLGVIFFGYEIKGATSWYSLGGFSLQPSELAKFATCIAMASFLSNYSTNIRDTRSQIIAVGLIALPIFLVMLQPDAGSAIVFLSFFIVLYRAGLSSNLYIVGFVASTLLVLGLIYDPPYVMLGLLITGMASLIFNERQKLYWLLALLGVIALSFLGVNMGYLYPVLGLNFVLLCSYAFLQWRTKKNKSTQLLFALLIVGGGFTFVANYAFNNVLERHQQERINVWLSPEKCDPRGSLYNVLQSKMTIGSGGLKGKGFLQGTMTKLNYVPEQSTDFIFCTVGEEQGLIGSVGIIGLFLLLLIRMTVIAERQRADFSRYYIYSVAGILFVHFLINIGMTMGLVPIIGIPLPFISYGGSSLLGFTLMIGVLLKLDSDRLYA